MPVKLPKYKEVAGVFNSPFIHIYSYLFIFIIIHKFASNQSQIYQFVTRQNFLFLYSINIRTPYLVISDHI